jgi:hypothetical protein
MSTFIYNEVTVSSESRAEIERLLHILENSVEGIFTTLVPPDNQTEVARVEAWGTSTEIFPENCSEEDDITIDDASDPHKLEFSFVTDSCPPTKVLEQLMRMGFHVKCHYQTLRVCYGLWEQGSNEYRFRSLL